jgi:phosphoribosylformimino-5-aminoimidazole carboxamide ribotide isomerase
MQILPVLDILNGVVVRGVAGRRSEYRPIVSRLTSASDALSVARAFRDRLGLFRFYLADLDAILHQRPNFGIYRDLAAQGFELLIDAGLKDIASARRILDVGAAKVIAGLETWHGPDELAELCQCFGAHRVIFSLDLLRGAPVGNLDRWRTADPFEIGCRAAASGVGELIVLDMAQVGVGEGITTAELCQRLQQELSGLSIITGGGVRNVDDLWTLARLGVNAVLVASALHDGRIDRDAIASLSAERIQSTHASPPR